MSQTSWPRYLALRRQLRALKEQHRGLENLGLPQQERRLLAIWDFRECPSNIGDILLLLQRMQLSRESESIDKVDYAFVGEEGRILSHNPFYNAGLNDENWRAPLPALLRTVYLSPHTGGVFFFDSYDALDDFLVDRGDRYQIWPTGRQHDAPQSAYGRNFDAVQDHYLTRGSYPPLEIRPALRRYAARFFLDHVAPHAPVVCQIRNNTLRPDQRNAPIADWAAFFANCAEKYDARFVLIGAAAEIDPRFRALPNVIVAKDHGTGLEEDLALASLPLIYLGTPSGPACMAILSTTPYVIFNFQAAWETVGRGSGFAFATAQQKLTWDPETEATITAEFGALWATVDQAAWWRRIEAIAASDGHDGQTRLLWDKGAA